MQSWCVNAEKIFDTEIEMCWKMKHMIEVLDRWTKELYLTYNWSKIRRTLLLWSQMCLRSLTAARTRNQHKDVLLTDSDSVLDKKDVWRLTDSWIDNILIKKKNENASKQRAHTSSWSEKSLKLTQRVCWITDHSN